MSQVETKSELIEGLEKQVKKILAAPFTPPDYPEYAMLGRVLIDATEVGVFQEDMWYELRGRVQADTEGRTDHKV